MKQACYILGLDRFITVERDRDAALTVLRVRLYPPAASSSSGSTRIRATTELGDHHRLPVPVIPAQPLKVPAPRIQIEVVIQADDVKQGPVDRLPGTGTVADSASKSAPGIHPCTKRVNSHPHAESDITTGPP